MSFSVQAWKEWKKRKKREKGLIKNYIYLAYKIIICKTSFSQVLILLMLLPS